MVVYYLGYDDSGRKRYTTKRGFKTKREAEQYLSEVTKALHEGTHVEPSRQTLESYLRSWLADKQTQIRPGTWRSYSWLVERHVIPRIGHLQLGKLRPSHLQKLYTEMQSGDEPLSKQSVLNAHRILHQALDRAVKWGHVPRNVADAVDPPKPQRQEMRVWNEDELNTFLDTARSSRYHTAFVLLSSTGMRVGELLALRWDSVDLDAGILRVVRAYSYTGKGYRLEEPKTDAGRRSITLPPSVTELLRRHRTVQAQERLRAGSLWENHDLVICTTLGRPVLQHNLRMLFQRLIRTAGLPRIRLHDLRHTHATILLKRGVHPKVVQERLGHSDISVTLNTYSHVVPGLQAAAAKAIDSIFATPPKNISGHEDCQ
ncbi:MAG: site-specific integrase [Alicyclobacillus herbarius]|nr:site-specific integrase [Alicyclobacillus herbarius]